MTLELLMFNVSIFGDDAVRTPWDRRRTGAFFGRFLIEDVKLVNSAFAA
jgi:hypothetical protein